MSITTKISYVTVFILPLPPISLAAIWLLTCSVFIVIRLTDGLPFSLIR